jgi:hypothetical protein
VGKTRRGRAGAETRERQMAQDRERLDSLRSDQAKLSAQLGGEAPNVKLAEADSAFRKNWQEQQRLIYPEIYRVADERLAGDSEPSAAPGVPLGIFSAHPIGLEPGHDPVLQERYRTAVEEGEIASDIEGRPATTEDTGPSVNNQAPGSNRVTTVPTERGEDDSVTPDSLAAAQDESEKQRARAGDKTDKNDKQK